MRRRLGKICEELKVEDTPEGFVIAMTAMQNKGNIKETIGRSFPLLRVLFLS